MPVESGNTISALDDTAPLTGDPVNQGDDHLKLIKSILKKQFPGENGQGLNTALTVKESEFLALKGVTSSIQAQINAITGAGVQAQVDQNVIDIAANNVLANTANNTANSANTTANTANSTANAANSTANSAQSTANNNSDRISSLENIRVIGKVTFNGNNASIFHSAGVITSVSRSGVGDYRINMSGVGNNYTVSACSDDLTTVTDTESTSQFQVHTGTSLTPPTFTDPLRVHVMVYG